MARPCGEFKARWEKRGDKPGLLVVSGECELPATYRADFKPHEPSGDDPEQLLLDLSVSLPSGTPPTGVESTCTLSLSWKMSTEEPPRTVKIIDVNSEEGETWEIPVRLLTQALAPAPKQGTKWSKMSRPNRV